MENTTPDTIPIALSTDSKYVIQICVVMGSIMRNTSKLNYIDFYILISSNLDLKSRKDISSICEFYENCSVNFIEVGNDFDNVKLTLSHVNTAVTFYRLLIVDYICKYDKCIYLDPDILVSCDIKELFSFDIDEYYVAGVKGIDYVSKKYGVLEYMKQTGLPSLNQYINSGVLLMNLKKMREDNFSEKVKKLLHKEFPTMDQDILNLVCYDKIFFLPLKFNLMTKHSYYDLQDFIEVFSYDQIVEAWESPAIIHYADKIKPWNDVYSSLADRWWNVLVNTPNLIGRLQNGEITLFNLGNGYKNHNAKVYKEYINIAIGLRDELISKTKNYKTIIIYGAGNYGKRLANALRKENINILAYAVTDKKDSLQPGDLHVYRIDDLEVYREEALIIIGTSEQYQEEVKNLLEQKEFKNIMRLSKKEMELLLIDIERKTIYEQLITVNSEKALLKK